MPEVPGRSKSKAVVERLGLAQGLTADEVASILEDREGNIWVGTDGGLDRFRYRNLSWFPLPGYRFSLVSGDHGQVWAGSLEGNSGRVVQSNELVRIGPSGVVMAYRDPDGTIWFSKANSLLHWNHGKFTKIDPPEQVREFSRSSIPNDPITVSSITKDRSGKLWVSFEGSGEFYLEDGVWKFLGVLPGHPDWSANYAFTDSSDRVWLAWGEAIAVLDHGKVHIFSTKDDLAVGPPNVIAEYDRHIWVGGQSGLTFLQGDRFHTLRTADGVSFQSITGIVAPPDGGLWLSTGLGIVHIPETEIRSSLEHYDHKVSFELFDLVSDLPEQLQRSKTWSSEAVHSDDDVLWFATRNGVARLDPAHIFRNPLAPPVTIRSVIADEKSYSPFASPRLPALTRNLEIDYTALSLSVPERVRFRYILEGLENKWNEAGSRRQAFYTDLGPGRYTFRVIACNNDGVWNDQGAILNFIVDPAWYQSAWFRVLSIIACILFAWTLYRFRLRQIAGALSAGFDERLAERTRIAQELHDTLLQGVLSASLQLDVAQDQLPEDSPTKSLLKRVLQLMRTVTEEGRTALGGLRTTETENQSLETAFARMRQEFPLKDKIDFRIIVGGVARPLRPMIRDEVYRIGREALVNAFMHANAKRIEVEVEYASRHLKVLVRDDGIGIDPQILHSGREGHWGLVGIRERSKKIGANLRLRSRIGAGTEIDLTVPGPIAFENDSSGPMSRWFRWLMRERLETPKQDKGNRVRK
jgi:signal transduction histidine kinase/streptogramin lyase